MLAIAAFAYLGGLALDLGAARPRATPSSRAKIKAINWFCRFSPGLASAKSGHLHDQLEAFLL